MTETMKAEDIPSLVGKELPASPWIEITQERVNKFAEATNDFQFIHVDPEKAAAMKIETIPMHESAFRWMMNEDPMATEKLAEGIRNFASDALKLEEFVCRMCVEAA